MSIYYLHDPLLQAKKNKLGEFHWAAYIPEMLSRIGVPYQAWIPGQTADFKYGDVMFIGSDTLSCHLPDELTIIGFATQGADNLFGIKIESTIPQPDGEFSLNGYFKMEPSAQEKYMNVPDGTPELPIFSPVRILYETEAEVLGMGLLKYNNNFYFTFDLPQTLWVSGQGKPITENAPGYPVGRLPLARVTPLDYNTEIAYGDYYLYILQNILADLGYAMLHCLPLKKDGTIPDFALYYAGDEDACSPELSADAYAFMVSRGLPYHINLMPFGNNMSFQLSPEQFDDLRERGCELALHYCMTGGEGGFYKFNEENFQRQYRAYLQKFGVQSISTVGHCLTHNGYAERMRFLAGMGIRGDFERCGEYDPVDINAFNKYGFAFGTAFPSFPYDDAQHGNKKIDFVEAPIAYYEPRIGEKYPDGAELIHFCLDSAKYFGRMVNLFTHPHYLSALSGYNVAMTHAAMDESLRYISEKGYNVIHSAPDRICEFWHGRGKSSVVTDGNRYYVDSATDGLIIRIPTETNNLLVDGNVVEPIYKEIDGRKWLMVAISGEGGHVIEV